MKTDFDENRVSELEDTLDAKHIDFDFEQVDALLKNSTDHLEPGEYDRLSQALNVLIAWIIGDEKTPPRSELQIARRVIGLAWAINPMFFADSPSLSEIARRLKIHKVVLSIHSAQAHRDFGIRNRAQSHGSNFKQNKGTTLSAHDHENEETNDQ